ncbi:MAG: hypothetical protein ACOVOX_14730 [Burkholderiaceae bacterium]
MATTSKPRLFGVREKLKPVVLSPTKVRQLRKASGLSVEQAAALLSMDALAYRDIEVSGSQRQSASRQPMNSSKAILFHARLELVQGNPKGALEVMGQRLPVGAKGLLAREAIESLGLRPLASQWVPGDVEPVVLNPLDVQQMRHASGLTLAEAALLLDRHPQYFGAYEVDEQGPAVTSRRMSRSTADLYRAGTALAAGFPGAALDVLAQTISQEASAKAVAALEALRVCKPVEVALAAESLLPGALAAMDDQGRGRFLATVKCGVDWPALNQLVMPPRTRGSSYLVLVRWWLLKYFGCWGDVVLHRLVQSDPSLMEFLGSGLQYSEVPTKHDSMRFAKRLQDLSLEKAVLAFVEQLVALPRR